MAKNPVLGPCAEFHLCNIFGPSPVDPFRLVTGRRIDKSRRVGFDSPQALRKSSKSLVIESCTHFAGIDQGSLWTIVSEQQRSKAGPGPPGIGEPSDYELLPHGAFHLLPALGPLLLIAAVGPL